MTDNSLRDRFDLLVFDEPTMSLTIDPVMAQGRRLRRRRRFTRVVGASAALTAATAAVAVPLVLQHRTAPTQTLSVQPFTLTGADRSVPAGAPPSAGLTREQQRMADAIRQASPDGWTFELGADRWDSALDVEATADDGAGPGRLMLGISTVPGAVQVHPCLDPEFASGVSCTERALPGGSVLSMRAVVDWRGVQTVEVVLTHADGTGVMAESGNFVLDWPPPPSGTRISAEAKKQQLHASRPDPTYTTAQLARVIVAVDHVTKS